jgi:hypothetical protein
VNHVPEVVDLPLPSQRTHCPGITGLVATALVAGIGAFAVPGIAGASTAPLTVVVSANAAMTADLTISCESPSAPAKHGVDIAGAATAERHSLAVPGQGGVQFQISDLTTGSACAVTASGPGAVLDAVDGGTPLVGSDGQVRGVAVTVDRGTPVTAHLTFQIPAVLPTAVPRTEATTATNAAGSGSAALAPPPLPGSDGAASAAAPVALAAARSTTTSSSAALPDPSGTNTALVMASVGVLLCGAVAYLLLLSTRRQGRTS